MESKMKHIYIYGPPGSGKSSLGKMLADELEMPFVDLDKTIVEVNGKSIPEIFQQEGEAGFRTKELAAIVEASKTQPSIISLGGGALLSPAACDVVSQTGQVICLDAGLDTILQRLNHESSGRPLLAGDTADRLRRLLEDRWEHYRSFPIRLVNEAIELPELVWKAQVLLGAFRVKAMGPAYDVRVKPDGLAGIGEELRQRGLRGPVAVITDQRVGPLYGAVAQKSLQDAGYAVSVYALPPGEEHKNINSVISIWEHLIQEKIERASTILALGGGVVGDMTGFAAATYVRGVAWVNVPTTLLAMVDSSLGGKTGIDLPKAKNMVGAFYPPRFVLIDPQVLQTLPERELRNGLAEVVKHGIIDDPELFERCSTSLEQAAGQLDWIVRRAAAVKVKVIEQDPYEKDLRQALNLGHTIGHGVEMVSGFQLSHGESVAIGMVAESRLAESTGLGSDDLTHRIEKTLAGIGLPTEIPGNMAIQDIIEVMQHDKKRLGGKVRFALPEKIGKVATGVVVEGWQQRLEKIAQCGG